jgi:Na+/H+-dicarboxylate symporter
VGGRALGWFVGLVAFTSGTAAVVVPPFYKALGAASWQIPDVGGAGAATSVTLPPFRDWFVGLLPSNPVQAAAQGDILPLVLFTIVFGLAATRIAPELRDTLVRGAHAVSETILVVVGWILATAPVGVFALTLALAERTGLSVIRAVGGFLIVVVVLIAVAIGVLYPLVRVVAGIPVRRFARACAPAQAVGFSTRSSMSTLPILLEQAERTLELPKHVTGLVLPAAVSVFKYASPMTRIAGTYLIATLYGIELSVVEWGSLAAFLAVLSFYSPGIPSGGLFVMAPIYQAFGLPLEGIGILIALDLVPDMFLTAANVTGNMAVAALVARSDAGPDERADRGAKGSAAMHA